LSRAGGAFSSNADDARASRWQQVQSQAPATSLLLDARRRERDTFNRNEPAVIFDGTGNGRERKMITR
jgi:hypothetical protein